MLNHITDAKRLEALASVREGRMYDLGRVLDEDDPGLPRPLLQQTLVTTAHHANAASMVGENDVNWVTEQVSATMQLGTHLDALSHLQIGDRGYNGWTVAELAGTAGVKRLGVETVPQIVTRGLLVDVSRLGPGAGDVITSPTSSRARRPRARAGRRPALPHRLGRPLGGSRRLRRGRARPGLRSWPTGSSSTRVALTGCDTWSYGPVPAEDPERPFEVPQILNARHGVFVVENLDTAELAADGVREFALILTHPKLRGATGAWTSPIALV